MNRMEITNHRYLKCSI